MTSFRQIEANRVRTQEKRSEKKLAKDDRGPHAVPVRRTAESRCRSGRDTGPPKHSKRLSSDDARIPIERDLVHRRHRHCGACGVPSLLSEFSRVSIDQSARQAVSQARGRTVWPPMRSKTTGPPSPLAIAGARKKGERMNSRSACA